MAIPIGIEGQITNSEHHSHVVVVQEETDQAGGFFILESWAGSNGPNPGGAFDSWVNDSSGLEQFFAEAGWVVQWKF